MNFNLYFIALCFLLSACGVKGPPVPPANSEIVPWADEYQITPEIVLSKERLDQLKEQLRVILAPATAAPTPASPCQELKRTQQTEDQKQKICEDFKIEFLQLDFLSKQVVITRQLPTMPEDALKGPYHEIERFCHAFEYKRVPLPPECTQP